MIDPDTINGVTTGLTNIVNFIRALKEGSGNTTPTLDKMDEQVVQLRGHVLNVQTMALNLQQENAELRAKLAKMEDWNAEKERYEMKAVGQTARVFALKPGFENSEPPHWICPRCYDDNQRSILNFEMQDIMGGHNDVWICSRCESRIRVRRGTSPMPSS